MPRGSRRAQAPPREGAAVEDCDSGSLELPRPDAGIAGRIRACLFDLDGVLTQTAKVHAAAWKQMFDAFLRARAKRTGEPFVPFDARARLRPSTSTASRATTASARSSPRAGSSCPRERRTIRPTPRRSPGSATARTSSCCELIREQGVEAYEGSVRYVQRRPRRRPALRRRLVERELPRRCSRRPGSPTCSTRSVDGDRRASASTWRASPRRTRSSSQRARSASSPREAAVFEDALAGVAAGRAGEFGFVVGVDRVGQADALREHGADVVVARPRRAARATRDRAAGLRGRAVVAARDGARPRPARADRVGVRALQRAHRPARQPRRGRAERPAGDVPQLVLRAAAAAVRRRRLRLSGVGPDDRQRHRRQDHPPARRRRAVRRPLRKAALARARARPARGRAAPHASTGRSPAGAAVRVRSTRLVSFAQRAVAAILYEVEPIDGPLRVVVQSELRRERAGRRAAELRPARSRRARVAAPVRGVLRPRAPGRCCSTRRSTASCGWAPAWTTSSTGPTAPTSSPRAARDVGRVTVAADLAEGDAPPRGEVPRVRLVEPALVPAIRDQVVAALAEARHTGWDGLLAAPARVPRRVLGSRRRRARGRHRAPAGRALRASSTRCRPARAPSSARSPAKGLTGPGYDGHTFWDSERFVLPVLTYTAPEAAPTRSAGGTRRSTSRSERAKQLGLAGAAFPWRTIRGQECSGYWPAGTAAFHIGADIADAVVRYLGRDGGRRVRARGRRSSCSSRRRASGARSAITIRRAASASTASPARTSTARSPTTTSTRTCSRSGTCAPPRTPSRAIRATPPSSAPTSRKPRPGATPREDMVIPWDETLGVHPQSEGFTEHQVWDFEHTEPEQYPLLLHFPYFDLYRKQVVKQADLVLALHVRGDAFTDEEKARDFAYYERADGSRLVALGVHAGGDRRRGRPPRARVRLLRRGGAHGPARPRAQHARRRAHRVARRRVDRRRRRLRRHARPRRQADVRAAPAGAAGAASRSASCSAAGGSRST